MMLPDARAIGCAWIGESTSGAPAAKASITSRASAESVSVSGSASMAASCADNGGSAVRSAAVAESMLTSVWNLDAIVGSTLRLLALA
eukprot:scaffold89474_cov73-Phaeocystis_antarctica.AAC.1